jgi:hypothetical protein
MIKGIKSRKELAAAVIAVAATLSISPALAEIPQVSHTASGHEVRWKNGCFTQFNPQGQSTYNGDQCTTKQVEKSAALVRIYIALHKDKRHDDYVDHKGASLVRLQDGGYEVIWQSNCFALYNHYGQAMHYSRGCDDVEIAKSSRIVSDYRRRNGYH